MSIEEADDGWTFRFDDALVTQLRVDYQFSLILACGAVVAIAEPFELSGPVGRGRVPANDAGAALPLFNQHVTALRALRSGELLIYFDSGAKIDVPVNEHYENWAVTWSDGESWIGLPGGGVARFPPHPASPLMR